MMNQQKNIGLRHTRPLVRIALAILLPVLAVGQSSFIQLSDGYGEPGSTENKIYVLIANREEVSGLQMTIEVDSTQVEITSVNKWSGTDDWELTANISAAGASIILTDYSAATLPAGTDTLMELSYSVKSGAHSGATAFRPHDLVVSGPEGSELTTHATHGYNISSGANILRLRDGYGVHSMDFQNESIVGGIQFDLAFDESLVIVDAIVGIDRDSILTSISYNEVAPGHIRVIMHSPSGVGLSIGRGPVLSIHLQRVDGASSRTTDLHLSNAVISSVDGNVLPSTTLDGHYYRGEIGTLATDESVGVPDRYALEPNYPNPFNPSTTINFSVPDASELSLIVYDLTGREISRLFDGRLEAGFHQMTWDGRGSVGEVVPTGVYIARLIAPGYSQSIKMVLLK